MKKGQLNRIKDKVWQDYLVMVSCILEENSYLIADIPMIMQSRDKNTSFETNIGIIRL